MMISIPSRGQEATEDNRGEIDGHDSVVYTIPRLAERLGVTAQAIRVWIAEGRIEPPKPIPVTGEGVYSSKAAERIEREFMVRAAGRGTRGPGAARRRERAQNFLRGRGITEANVPTPAEIVLNEVHRWLELADDLLPTVVLTTVVANKLSGLDPVWVMIVAPPSSGKTEVISAVEEIEGVYPLGKLTGRTFVSGMVGDNRSLLLRLSRLGKWLMTHKDWGTVMSLNPNERNEVLAQLRQIYDGKVDAEYGTGARVKWRGKLGFIVGATPAVDRLQAWSTSLGERFVQFRPTAPDKHRVSLRASLNKGREGEMRKALADAYVRAASEAERMAAADHEAAPQGELVAGALGRLVATARTPVTHDRYRGGYEVAESEGPARLTGVFTQLYRAADLVFGGDHEAATALVVRVGIDSITPGVRRKLITRLAAVEQGRVVEGLGRSLGCDDGTARRHLDDLCALGLATSHKPARTTIYSASELLGDLAAQVYLDEFSPQEALRKLSLLYTQHIHEEKGKE